MTEPISYLPSHADLPNKSALWSMILGIIGLVLSVAVIGGVIGLAALILGIFAVIRPGRKGMAITGITTGTLALPVAFIALFFWVGLAMGFSTARATSRRTATRAEIAKLQAALDAFEVDNDRDPSTSEGLDALVNCPPDVVGMGTWKRKLDSIPLDSWGHPFEYQGPDAAGDEHNIISAGPDGVFGTPDDIDIYTKR